MNTDLISREALKEALAKEIKTNDMGLWLKILLVIDNAPTVEPVRPHGKWVPQGGGFSWVFKCSCCGWVDGYPFNERHKYCPNCGSDMGEAEE